MSSRITILSSFTRDLIVSNKNGKYVEKLGGPAFYVSVVFESLGTNYSIMTSSSNRIFTMISYMYPEIASRIRSIYSCDSDFVFMHKYISTGIRESKLISRGCDLLIDLDLLARNEWLVISPVLGEISIEMVRKIAKRVGAISLDVQGFIRKSDIGESIINKPTKILGLENIDNIKIIHASYEELLDLNKDPEDLAVELISRIRSPITSLTMGRQGSFLGLYRRGSGEAELYYIPAYIQNADMEDPTGCGDIYLAALTYYIASNKDPVDAGLLASIIAGIRVYEGIPLNIDPDRLSSIYNDLKKSIRKIGVYKI